MTARETLPLYLPNSGYDEAFVNRWSPVTNCMTTSSSRPAAVTQMRARVSWAMHPEVFICQTTFLPQLSLFPDSGTNSQYAAFHILKLGISNEVKLTKNTSVTHVTFDFLQLGLDRVASILDGLSLVNQLAQRTDDRRPLEVSCWSPSRQRPLYVSLTSSITTHYLSLNYSTCLVEFLSSLTSQLIHMLSWISFIVNKSINSR